MKQLLFKNWKTSLGALLMAIVATLQGIGKISTDQAVTATSVIGALGLAAAKDGNVSGE